MSFEKKVWVNVPDPNNPPEIPEGQDALARFDADNMNRIEDGIANSLQKDGGVMTGGLFLNGNSNEDNEAVTKNYVDNSIKFYTANISYGLDTWTEVCTIPDYNPDKHLVFLCDEFTIDNGTEAECTNRMFKLDSNEKRVYYRYNGKQGGKIKLEPTGKILYYDTWSTSQSFLFLVIPAKISNL